MIDIYSIQLWFGALIGSFTLVYVFWSLFIVEDDPKAHFPAHMLGHGRTDDLFVHQSNEPIQGPDYSIICRFLIEHINVKAVEQGSA